MAKRLMKTMAKGFGLVSTFVLLLSSDIVQEEIFATGLKIGDKQHKTANPATLTLSNYENVQYYGTIQVGNAVLQGVMDTGSFEILVLSSQCMRCRENVDRSKLYNASSSPTAEEPPEGMSQFAQHTFGSGPTISELMKDKVVLAGDVAEHQIFWAIRDHEITVLDGNNFQGIIGFGKADFDETNNAETLLKNLEVDEFAFCLQRGDGADGFLFLEPQISEADKAFFRSVDVIGESHWGLHLNEFKIESPSAAGTFFARCGSDEPCAAIVDSGTSLLTVPQDVYSELAAHIGTINEDCSNVHALKPVTFKFANEQFSLPGDAYVVRQDGKCMLGIMAMHMVSQFGPVYIFGMPFLRHYYSVFDRTNHKLKFAAVNSQCQYGNSMTTTLSHGTANATSPTSSHQGAHSEEEAPLPMHLSKARVPAWANAGKKNI